MISLLLHADSHSPKLFIPMNLRAVAGLGTAMSICYMCQRWDVIFLLCGDGDGASQQCQDPPASQVDSGPHCCCCTRRMESAVPLESNGP